MLSLIRSLLLLVAFALLGLPCPGHAQGMLPSGAGGGSGFQLVQRVDEVLFGVDPVSLGLIDNRYVSGTFVRVNVLRPSPVIGYTSFVADCASPQRIAISESASATEDRHAERFQLLPQCGQFALLDIREDQVLLVRHTQFALGVLVCECGDSIELVGGDVAGWRADALE